MSSDDGVYIGEFPHNEHGTEYRVIHAQAIENCDHEFDTVNRQDNERLQDCERMSYYGKATPLYTKAAATLEAHRLYEGLINGAEYGICTISYDRPLPNKTVEQAQAELDAWWEEVKQRNDREREEREANTREYFVLVPVRVREYQDNINYCGLTQETIRHYRDKFGRHESAEAASKYAANIKADKEIVET